VRVAIIAETFLPTINGVTRSVERTIQHLAAQGHEILVVTPAVPGTGDGTRADGVEVMGLASLPLPAYPGVRVALAGVPRIRRILSAFAPDVVHLASPFELGWKAAQAASQLGLPTVAVYQTDLPGYATRYGLPFLSSWAAERVRNVHALADRTLAPSTAAIADLGRLDVPRVELWRRGVDAVQFHPGRRSGSFRAGVAAPGTVLLGYVGRLAAEKQVEDLAAVASLENTRLVIIGDGPRRAALEAALPGALFTGHLGGDRLTTAMASLDVFIHPGELETFCQTIQEAMASAVPVVATGRGGPVDLVDSSRTGWLYTPGDLGELHDRVADLAGDGAKRRAFGAAAYDSVRSRTWHAAGEELLGHYDAAITLRGARVS
jgi:phosphatidylinositol alpha 1,6-mannosyltransferase